MDALTPPYSRAAASVQERMTYRARKCHFPEHRWQAPSIWRAGWLAAVSWPMGLADGVAASAPDTEGAGQGRAAPPPPGPAGRSALSPGLCAPAQRNAGRPGYGPQGPACGISGFSFDKPVGPDHNRHLYGRNSAVALVGRPSRWMRTDRSALFAPGPFLRGPPGWVGHWFH